MISLTRHVRIGVPKPTSVYFLAVVYKSLVHMRL